MPPKPGAGNALTDNPVTGTDVALAGVTGESNTGAGVSGRSIGLTGSVGPGGVQGQSGPASDGVVGEGVNGVHGVSQSETSATTGAGVWGENTSGDGVVGRSSGDAGAGVRGISEQWDGVHGESQSSRHAGVSGTNTGGGFGLWASGKIAGRFEGDVSISGNITEVKTIMVSEDVVLTGADCAEQFDVCEADSLEPGTPVVIDDEGKLRESDGAYDTRVAGVVSGAGGYKPAIVLDRQRSSDDRSSVALVGKVFCKVDADAGAIAVGDLLTTSSRRGFAMKADDRAQAFGAVIGKALRPLHAGQDVIPIMVALQ